MGQFVIHDTELSKRRLVSSVNVPRAVKKYFNSTSFFVEYDRNIEADRSILNIPLLATVLPIAWFTGSDISVDCLDRTFRDSMEDLKQVFHKTFLETPFTTQINADELVENRSSVDRDRRTALFFSGGIDSTYSLITNLNKKPALIMCWGVDDYPYPENKKQWDKIISTYKEFADKLDLQFYVVKTNVTSILDNKRIEHDFSGVLHDNRFRPKIHQSLLLLPLAAPLSIGRFDRLIVAAGGYPRFQKIPSGSRPETDEKIAWADLKVKHSGYIPRHEKVAGALVEYYKENPLKLKVCLRKMDSPELNDSKCRKCFRTIASLALEGINPAECGFNIDDPTFLNIRNLMENNETRLYTDTWTHMQKMIPEKIEHDFHGSKEFFEWFRKVDLDSREQSRENLVFYRDIYNRLPYPVANMLDKVYRLGGINIQYL